MVRPIVLFLVHPPVLSSAPFGERTHGHSTRFVMVLPPPPLSKHGQGQKDNGHTGSSCLDKGGGGYMLVCLECFTKKSPNSQ